jgi:hypothetical protein
MRHIKQLKTIMPLFLVYAAFAFVLFELNPFKWGQENRGCFVFFFAVIQIAWLMVLHIFDSINKE